MHNLAELAPLLRSANPTTALGLLQLWCGQTPLIQVRTALLSLPATVRPSIAAAVKDILSNYPETLWGVPFLVFGRRDPSQGLSLPARAPVGELLSLRQILAAPGIPAACYALPATRPSPRNSRPTGSPTSLRSAQAAARSMSPVARPGSGRKRLKPGW